MCVVHGHFKGSCKVQKAINTIIMMFFVIFVQLSHHLCMILLYDLLLGKGIQCGGPMKRFILNHKADLLIAFKENTKRNSDSLLIGTSGIILYYTRNELASLAHSF